MVGGNGDDLAWLDAAVALAGEGGWSVEATDDTEAMARLAVGAFDLIVCVCDDIDSAADFAVLIDRHPKEYSQLVEQYAALLALALEQRSVKVDSRLGEELNTLADRLGLLGAEPRDIVDPHRSALTGCLEGQSIRRARAYVEVGRLLLLQIMGILASFYRHLSCGTARAPRSRLAPDTTVAFAAMTTGDESI